MSFRVPPPLIPALVGLQPPVAVPASPSAARDAVADTPAVAAPLGLSFAGWSETPGVPLVLGARPYPGDAADPRAIADAIAGLLFGRH
jgi:hypothetical protein